MYIMSAEKCYPENFKASNKVSDAEYKPEIQGLQIQNLKCYLNLLKLAL